MAGELVEKQAEEERERAGEAPPHGLTHSSLQPGAQSLFLESRGFWKILAKNDESQQQGPSWFWGQLPDPSQWPQAGNQQVSVNGTSNKIFYAETLNIKSVSGETADEKLDL